jgi:protease I
MPKVLLIIAPQNFRDEELFETQEELNKGGVKTIIASTSTKEATGKLGGKATPDLSFADVKVDDYDAVGVIGGSGAPSLANYPVFFELLKEFKNKGKLITAICISPILLAQAGLLQGKKATVWNGDGKQSAVLEKYGAIFVDQKVVLDGDTITANGPQAARQFGQTIVLNL